jgi:hyperosmotically inducible protein
MTKTMGTTWTALLATTLAGALLSLPQLSLAAAPALALPNGASALPQENSPAASDAAAARLNKKQFHNVKVTVENGIATLTGSVDLFEYKADAEKHVRHVKGVTAVRNMIEVGGPTVSDQELQTKLLEKLSYDRVGYGNTFNAISLSVQNGVVTLAGHARTDVDKDSALALVSLHPGVKDVINDVEVDPASGMDDQTRLAVARAIYGYPSLNKYAIDPVKPIRISVQSGNVELYGMVDSQSDKDVAFLRANGVPGIFSVKNYLQVANQPSESKR